MGAWRDSVTGVQPQQELAGRTGHPERGVSSPAIALPIIVDRLTPSRARGRWNVAQRTG